MYLGRNSEKDVRSDIRKIFDIVNYKARKLKLYDEPLPLAIDFHLEPYYGKCKNKTIKTDKKKSHAGTAYNFKYATADIALETSPLTVYGQHISQLDTKADIFQEVVEYSRQQMDIKYLMADREFFTVKIMKYLLKEKIPYIIPAVKNKAILKEANEKFNEGTYVFTHPFGGKDGVDITIFIKRNEDFDISKTSSSKNPEFYVFSTNMRINQADKTAENIRHCDPKNYSGWTRDELAEMGCIP
jgi:DDE family transposase